MGVDCGYERCVVLEGRACVRDLTVDIGTVLVVVVDAVDRLSICITSSLLISVILSMPCLERGVRWGCWWYYIIRHHPWPVVRLAGWILGMAIWSLQRLFLSSDSQCWYMCCCRGKGRCWCGRCQHYCRLVCYQFCYYWLWKIIITSVQYTNIDVNICSAYINPIIVQSIIYVNVTII